jgi:hypothetical protein
MIMPIALLISPRMRQATENFQTQVCLRPFNSGFRLFHIGKLKKPSARYVRKPDNVACASLRRVYLSLRVARCLVGTHTHTHTHRRREKKKEGFHGPKIEEYLHDSERRLRATFSLAIACSWLFIIRETFRFDSSAHGEMCAGAFACCTWICRAS